MGIFSYLSLSVKKQIILNNSLDVFVGHFFLESFIDVDGSSFKGPIYLPLYVVPEKSHHGYVIIIPALFKTDFKLFEVG